MNDLLTYLYFRQQFDPMPAYSFEKEAKKPDESEDEEDDSQPTAEPADAAEAGDFFADVAELYRSRLEGGSTPDDDDFWPGFFERMNYLFPLDGGNPYRQKRRQSMISEQPQPVRMRF